jgi:hypothetical protein
VSNAAHWSSATHDSRTAQAAWSQLPGAKELTKNPITAGAWGGYGKDRVADAELRKLLFSGHEPFGVRSTRQPNPPGVESASRTTHSARPHSHHQHQKPKQHKR